MVNGDGSDRGFSHWSPVLDYLLSFYSVITRNISICCLYDSCTLNAGRLSVEIIPRVISHEGIKRSHFTSMMLPSIHGVMIIQLWDRGVWRSIVLRFHNFVSSFYGYDECLDEYTRVYACSTSEDLAFAGLLFWCFAFFGFTAFAGPAFVPYRTYRRIPLYHTRSIILPAPKTRETYRVTYAQQTGIYY